MFREMRRNKQQLSEEETVKILEQGSYGVLSVLGDEGYPYGIPLNYIYDNNKIYFHCAMEGHKLDAIKRNEKVSFCVTAEDLVVPEKYTTYFKSVIVFGTGRIMENGPDKNEITKKLAIKYYPQDSEAHRTELIEKDCKRMCMVEITIRHMTGKQAIELVK